ncbi:30S ribosomal protein S5 [uncultured archaeon]|nr:30S ribosomal protein S5 [uncultured archaeon]
MKLRRGKVRRTAAVAENIDAWVPKTSLGKSVKSKEVGSLEDILQKGKPILESEIVDTLVPTLMQETIELSSTQRMTDSGRKAKYRAVVVVGDSERYIGIGSGKADEVRPAIEAAVKDAKINIIHTNLGCGSSQCNCGTKHSLPIQAEGKYGGVTLLLKPAPRGTGIVANKIVKRVLQLAGVKDVWTKAEGRTKNRFSTAMAVVNAIDELNRMRIKQPWS